MKQYLIVIIYNSEKNPKQVIAMQDTQDQMLEWVNNTLEIDNVKEIVVQQFAIIETIKYEKDEE